MRFGLLAKNSIGKPRWPFCTALIGEDQSLESSKVCLIMCGITGILSLNCARVPNLDRRVQVLTDLVAHRGPDGSGIWTSPRSDVGFGHRRLSIIDLSENAAQPM